MPGITQVRLSGFGGQGIVLGGLLLGQAGVFEKKYVSGSNFYGAQARGSECKSEVIFSDGPIDFPHLTIADILISMSQGTYDIYSKDVREKTGLILFDQGQVTPREGLAVNQIGVPATEHAIKKLKSKQVSNIVLLGALVDLTRIISPGAVQKAIRLHVNERFLPLNLEAFRLGTKLGRRAHG
jgi:2-oxoglutarate ferredoxin oxidoreductase subunit gamma